MDLSVTEIQQKVKEYNAQINSNLFMNLVSSNNCSYTIAVSSNIAITLTLSALPCCYCSTPLLHSSTCWIVLMWIRFVWIPKCFHSFQQNKDGSYTGFIKVQFKLVRPVSVPPPRKGTATQDGAGKKNGGVKRCTSFYLPKDTSKHLHISSRTCAREVIEALLKKFTVVDNPGKFALFERTERHDQGKPTSVTGFVAAHDFFVLDWHHIQ